MIRVATRCSIQACCSGVKAGAAGGAAGVVGNAGVSDVAAGVGGITGVALVPALPSAILCASSTFRDKRIRAVFLLISVAAACCEILELPH